MIFADIHNHSLASADDGASSEEIMYRMVDAAYADGTRLLCLTPHFHPICFGDNRQASLEGFQRLQAYATEHCPELRLYLGNELRYGPNCDSWIREGFCRPLGNSSLILVDFPMDVEERIIVRGLSQILSMGYRPVLAHAERYPKLSKNTVRDFVRNGVQIQINADSLAGSYGPRHRARQLLRHRLVSMVASDAHDLHRRTPGLSHGYELTVKLTDKEYADRLFYRNAVDLLENNREGLVKEDE